MIVRCNPFWLRTAVVRIAHTSCGTLFGDYAENFGSVVHLVQASNVCSHEPLRVVSSRIISKSHEAKLKKIEKMYPRIWRSLLSLLQTRSICASIVGHQRSNAS